MANASLGKKTVTGFLWRLGERIGGRLVTFIVSIVLARILMPEEFGLIAFVLVFVYIAEAVVVNGLGTALVQKKDADELDFSTTFYMSIAFALGLYLILFATAPLLAKVYQNEQLTVVLWVLGARLPVSAINSVQQAFVQREMAFRKFFLSSLLGTVASAVVGIWMAYAGYGVWALVAQYMIDCVVDTIVLALVISWRPKLMFSWKRFKGLFKYGWKLAAAGLIGATFNQLGNLLVGFRYNSEDLAYYNRGQKLPELISDNIGGTLESVLFPALAKVQDDRERFIAGLAKAITYTSFFVLPALFGLAAIADTFVDVVLTSKWVAAVPFIWVFCIGNAFCTLDSCNLSALKAIGRSDVVFRIEFIKKPVVLGVMVGMLFISPLAVAIGAAATTVFCVIVNSIACSKYVGFSFWGRLKIIAPFFFASVIMGASVYGFSYVPIPNRAVLLVLQIVLGVIVYGVAIFILRPKWVKAGFAKIKRFLHKKEKAEAEEISPENQAESMPNEEGQETNDQEDEGSNPI